MMGDLTSFVGRQQTLTCSPNNNELDYRVTWSRKSGRPLTGRRFSVSDIAAPISPYNYTTVIIQPNHNETVVIYTKLYNIVYFK